MNLSGKGWTVAGVGRRRVGSHVSRYHVAPARAVGAPLALVGLLARMRSLVGGQVIAAAEHLFALAALVRLQARVESRVAR